MLLTLAVVTAIGWHEHCLRYMLYDPPKTYIAPVIEESGRDYFVYLETVPPYTKHKLKCLYDDKGLVNGYQEEGEKK